MLTETLVARQAAQPSWDFFRGASFDGHSTETGLVESFPEEGPPVLWSRKLGQGFSSFTGRGDRVFTQYQTVSSQFVVCLDATNGRTIWAHRYDWSYETAGLYPGPRSTPTLDGDKLYYTTPRGKLGCLNQSDGKLIWKASLTDRFKATPVGFGYACSPVIVDEKLILPVGGPGASVVAFNKHDGSIVWQSGNDEISYASILPIKHAGQNWLVAYLKNSLVLLDQQTGELIAKQSVSNGYDEHSAWPIYREPYLWISAPFRRGSKLFRLTSDQPPQFKRAWESDVMSNDVCSSVLVDGSLYGFDIYDVQSKIHRPSRGQFRCIDFVTGQPNWSNGSPRQRRTSKPAQETTAEDPVGHCSVIYADGKLILLSDTGELIVLAANSDRFDLLARIRVLAGEICWTQPMLLNQRLYLRNHSQVVCLYLGDPSKLDRSKEHILTVSESLQTPYLDLASWIYSVEPEYAMDAPTREWLINWYWIMLIAGWLVAFPAAMIMASIANRCCRQYDASLLRRIFYRTIAIAIGIVGTTLISGWTNQFVFTWPLVLAIVFEMLVFQTRSRAKKILSKKQGGFAGEDDPKWVTPRENPWAGRLAVFVFLATCLLYFYLCRRLSLAFEWSFLVGFPAAVPFLVWARSYSDKRKPVAAVVEWLLTAIAFTAFYWLGAAVIIWKY